MKNHIDSNFAIAILALVAACVGFSFWFLTASDDLVPASSIAIPSSSAVKVDRSEGPNVQEDVNKNTRDGWSTYSIDELGINLDLPSAWTEVVNYESGVAYYFPYFTELFRIKPGISLGKGNGVIEDGDRKILTGEYFIANIEDYEPTHGHNHRDAVSATMENELYSISVSSLQRTDGQWNQCGLGDVVGCQSYFEGGLIQNYRSLIQLSSKSNPSGFPLYTMYVSHTQLDTATKIAESIRMKNN